MYHPSPDNLEAFAEGILRPDDRAVVASHLLACHRCEGVVEDWRSLFHALSALPRFAPAVGFADRVMRRVRVRQPWHARAGAAFGRYLPHTTRGWALAAAFLALPVLAGGSFAAWLLSKSYVTTHGLWVFATDRFFGAAQSGVVGVTKFLMQTDIAAWLARSAGTVFSASGARGLGALAAASAVLIVLSAWILYTNLFRTPDRKSHYVTFSF
jgi:hypothetical protein